jgi:hypothetical protein
MEKMTRTEYDRKYNYRKVISSDNIDLHHCGDCNSINYFKKGITDFDGCSTMERFSIPPEQTKVNCSNGVCRLWRRKKQ